ncbi:MAG: hypothetical protein WCJ55_10105 [Chloroflexales bacterium]
MNLVFTMAEWEQAADYFHVSRRTICRWVQSSEYAQVLTAFKVAQKDAARAQIAGLADEIITNMYRLMIGARGDLVHYHAAKTLGEWIGLDTLEVPEKADDRSETMELMRMIAARPPLILNANLLPPPKPGGGLPDLTGSDGLTLDIQAESGE